MTKSKSGAATSRCCDAFALQIQIRRTYLARTHAVDQQLHNSMASDIRHFQFFIPACKNAMNEKNRNGIFFCIVLPVQHEQMDSDSLSTNQMERMTAFKGTEHKIQPTLTYTKKKKRLRKMQLGTTHQMDSLFWLLFRTNEAQTENVWRK